MIKADLKSGWRVTDISIVTKIPDLGGGDAPIKVQQSSLSKDEIQNKATKVAELFRHRNCPGGHGFPVYDRINTSSSYHLDSSGVVCVKYI